MDGMMVFCKDVFDLYWVFVFEVGIKCFLFIKFIKLVDLFNLSIYFI